MNRLVTVQCPKTRGEDPCPYCGTQDCSGHPQEDAKSFYVRQTAPLMRIECSGDEGDEPCPYCGPDCAGHDPEDAESFSGWVSMDLPRDDGDEPCPYCQSYDCAGHNPEDAGSYGSGQGVRWVAMGDKLPELAVMFYTN